MSLADNLLVNALVQRARQESQAMTQGRLGLGPDPNEGRGLNLGRGAGVALAPLHALGLVNEGADRVGGAVSGEMLYLAAKMMGAARSVGGTPADTPMGRLADDIAAQGPLHPGRIQELAEHSPNRVVSWGAGAQKMLYNPLNWAGTAARAPGLLGTAGKVGEAVNVAPFLPIRALMAARRGVPVGDELARALGLAAPAAQSPELAAAAADFASKASQRGPIPPRILPEPLAQGPLRRGQTTLDPTQLPSGPNLPPVVGPPRPGRRVVPETTLPDISYRPGNVPGRTPIGPALPPELGPLLPPEQGPALPTQGNVPRNLLELIGRKRQLGPPVPPAALPALTEAVAAPQVASTVADLGGNVSRDAVVRATANGPVAQLNTVLRDIHNAVYPAGSRDFAIPALTGVGARDFRTSFLTDHPEGNAAEPYLDYLISRVQRDTKAADRLAQSNPDLLADIRALPEHPRPLEEQKRTIQAMFGAGPFKDDVTRAVAGATKQIATANPSELQTAFDAILASGDSGTMGGELPAGTAFWEKRLGVGPDEARALLDGAVADGRLGVGPDGALRFKPRAALSDAPLPGAPADSAATLANVDIPAAPPPVTPTQARDELFADAADKGVADVAQAGTPLRLPHGAEFRSSLPAGAKLPRFDSGDEAGAIAAAQAYKADRPLYVVPTTNGFRIDTAPPAGRGAVAILPDGTVERTPWEPTATGAAPDLLRGQRDIITEAAHAILDGGVDPARYAGAVTAAASKAGIDRRPLMDAVKGLSFYRHKPELLTEWLVNFTDTAQDAGVDDDTIRRVLAGLRKPTPGGDIAAGGGGGGGLGAFMADAHPDVLNADGTPKVFYHGTGADFAAFRRGEGGMWGGAIYLTDQPLIAGHYAGLKKDAAPNIKPLYVSLKNPAVVDDVPGKLTTPPDLVGVPRERFVETAQALGYDGVINHGPAGVNTYIAFDPRQVKSATGNRGTYDPSDPSLLRAASPAINRATEAGVGAVAGGAIGGAAGLTQGDTPEERRANALKGAGIGLAVGGNVGFASPELLAAARQLAPAAAQKLGGSVLDPELQAMALQHAWDAQQAAPETAGVRGVEAFGAFWRQWGRQVVHTLKQFPQDATTRLTTLAGVAEQEFPGTSARIPFWQKGLVQERAGQQSFLNNPVTGWFRDTGHADLIPLHGDIVGAEGTDVALAPQGKQFGGLGRAISGGLMSAWTGNPIAIAYGAARGYAAPFVDAYVGLLNGAQHDALRFGMLESALDREMPQLADTFLADLRSRGVDTATLDGLGGRFSAADVDALAPGAGRDWADASEFLIRAQGDRIAFLSGDFRDKLAPGYTGKVTTLDKVVGRALKGLGPLAPFVQWQIRYTPVLAEIAARNPVATRLTLAAMAQGGTVDISTETPVLGAGARLRLGGQAGTVKVNPFAAVTPYSPESVGQAPELPEDATLYQRATNLGGKVGIRPHPLIQALAYVGGQDYRAPSSLSRTAGLEGLADIPLQLAGVPNGPSVRGALDAGRQLLSPVTGAGIPQSDPTATRYAELVLRATGKPLADPANRGYMETIGERDNPLWVRALLESRGLAAAGNATGMVAPVPVTARSQEGLASKAAPKLPATIGQIRAAPSSDRAALLDAYQRAAASSPASATYAGTNSKDRKFILLQRWDAEHQALKRYTPQLYADRRAAYAESLR